MTAGRQRRAAPPGLLLLGFLLCLPVVAAASPRSETAPPDLPALRFRPEPTLNARAAPLLAPPWDDDAPAAPAPAPSPGAPPALLAPAAPDWGGILRDTGYLVGYQALAFGVLYLAPEGVSNWSSEQKRNYDFGKYAHNVQHPVWDEDTWYINYLAHPYFGSAYYLSARGRGFGRWGSFVYAFVASDIYEFGTEAFAEPASIQDIIVTPLGGAFLGMLLEDSWTGLVAAGETRSRTGSVVLFLMDPLGRTNRALDRVFGFEKGRADLHVLPVVGKAAGGGRYTGLEVSLRW